MVVKKPVNSGSGSPFWSFVFKAIIQAALAIVVIAYPVYTSLMTAAEGQTGPANLIIEPDTIGNIIKIIEKIEPNNHEEFEQKIVSLYGIENTKKIFSNVDADSETKEQKVKAFLYNVYSVQILHLNFCFGEKPIEISSNRYSIDDCHNKHTYFGGNSDIDAKSHVKYLTLAEKIGWLNDLGRHSKYTRERLIQLEKINKQVPLFEGWNGGTYTLKETEVYDIREVGKKITAEINNIHDPMDRVVFKTKPDKNEVVMETFETVWAYVLLLFFAQMFISSEIGRVFFAATFSGFVA